MKQIWAPWRMEYILSDKRGGCFLCEAAGDAGKDAENLVVARSGGAFITMNRFPYNNGHLLVAPTAHIGDPDEAPGAEMLDVMEFVGLGKKLLEEALSPEGFNIGCNLGTVAGAGLPGHLHIHIVPRWGADTNFMPVVSDTRVISEAVVETFRKLKEAYDKTTRREG